MAGVKFQSVYKFYDNKIEVIKNFNLEIQDREFLILVGPSGCGKSTVLRMIAGLEEVSKGELLIGDRIVNNVHPRDRNIAMVFQNYALYPHMTVRENMGFSLKLKGMDKKEVYEKVEDVAKILGLEALLDRKPKQMSGGQRQRVAMGRAIVRNPAVFLFDEPLSNLDAKLRVQMRVELAKLHRQLRTTIVYVTHDQVEAMTLADRIVVMKDGFIQQVGTPLELYEEPANAFVGAFIGSPSMNQISATLQGENGEARIRGKDFSLPLSPERATGLKEYQGKEVLLGVRPQDLIPKREVTPEEVALQAEVDVIEPMGGESYIYFTLEEKQWVSRCEGIPPVKEGEKISMVVNLDKLHIFSADGERRLG